MHHTPITPVRHHPDLRWVIVVTAIVTSALALLIYSLSGLTRPAPAAELRANAQTTTISQMQTQIQQLGNINDALQAEIKSQATTIASLKLQILASTASSTVK